MKLSDIIKQHRKKSGLTQAGLARLACVGKTAVFDIEHGKTTIRFETLLKILHVLNIGVQLQSPLTGDIALQEEEEEEET
jgi:y4mF family transcriptional regulator